MKIRKGHNLLPRANVISLNVDVSATIGFTPIRFDEAMKKHIK